MELTKKTLSRRGFIKASGMAGTVLAVGYYFPSFGKEAKVVNANLAKAEGIELNQFIYIGQDGKITIIAHRPEMGQGVYQSMPTLIAEELEVNLDDINIVQAPANQDAYGHQQVGGSSSVRLSWEPSRKMGATAREMLIMAAANQWGVSTNECYASEGYVINRTNKSKLSYGELVESASKLKAPSEVKLKEKKDFKILGKPLHRKDLPLKTNGVASFGIDMEVPEMVYASIDRSPVFQGKVKSFDDSETMKVPGVQKVIKSEMPVFKHTRFGVAVIADNYWSALQGRKALKVEWDESEVELLDNEKIFQQYREESKKDGIVADEQGDVKKGMSEAKKFVEATYECPFEAHSPMEPMNIIVSVKDKKCELWGPIQSPNWIRRSLAEYLEIPVENVTINVSFLGGGFGRRAFTDFPLEGAYLSKQLGKPVKIVWTREDDTTQGPFRPATVNVFKAGLADNGKLIAMEKKGVYQELRHQFPGSDETKVGKLEGANKAYEIPNSIERIVPQNLPIPVMWWRSVYASTNGFAYEAFIDEVAEASGKDPIDFRMSILENESRYTEILKKLKEKSDWKKDSNSGYGVAIVESFGSICGQVVQVKKTDGELKVEKVTAVIDCGMYINPDTIVAQIEGSIIMGMQAAYKSEITFKNGRAEQQNFDKYKMPRIPDTPAIAVHIMENEEAPGGVGEPGLPPFAPALANAIFNESGKRIRKLPFNLKEV
ncbi:MAG: molybdopterin cofactor-binding domain-containing protein [Bacteroidota bacterium]